MNETPETSEARGAAAQARDQAMRWPSSLVWIIPFCALIAAVFYLGDFLAGRGPIVTDPARERRWFKSRRHSVLHRGVQIGR